MIRSGFVTLTELAAGAAAVLAASRVMSLAGRLWPSWRAAPTVARGDDPKLVNQLMAFWANYGAVGRRDNVTPPVYQLVTHPQRDARGKCARCGREKDAKWIELLGDSACPHCRAMSRSVIVARIG